MQMVRQAMVLDLSGQGKRCGFQQIVVVTSYPELARRLRSQVEVVLTGKLRGASTSVSLRDAVENCR